MTSTNSSKFCKSCGDYRQIEDNKCTVCDAEYSDGGLLKYLRNVLFIMLVIFIKIQC